MEQKRSQSLILTPSEVKARRLKMLQTIEARRLELVNRQLSRAETKALRQLDFQRTAFRRRLSDVTGQFGSDGLTDLASRSFAPSGDSSPGEGSRVPPYRITRSLSKVGRSIERSLPPRRLSKYSIDTIHACTHDPDSRTIEETRPPFWIRIPSLGISSDLPATAFTSSSEPESPTMQSNSKGSSQNSLLRSPSGLMESEDDSSPSGTIHAVGRFHFPSGEEPQQESTPRASEMRPLWLKALYKLREQRYARLHGQHAEECEQLAALVTGCGLTSPVPANTKRSGTKPGAVAR